MRELYLNCACLLFLNSWLNETNVNKECGSVSRSERMGKQNMMEKQKRSSITIILRVLFFDMVLAFIVEIFLLYMNNVGIFFAGHFYNRFIIATMNRHILWSCCCTHSHYGNAPNMRTLDFVQKFVFHFRRSLGRMLNHFYSKSLTFYDSLPLI